MSMNLFFQAFPVDDIKSMMNTHSLIDKWVYGGERAVIDIDIEDAWDVLNNILGGTGFESDEFVDDVLSNGCEVLFSETVKRHAAALSEWTHERLLDALRQLDPDDGSYHFEHFRDQNEDLLEEFDKLCAFYQQAAQAGLGVIEYAA
ncbi:MAG: DUF1877 family protein [Pseudomonadota bacterium]